MNIDIILLFLIGCFSLWLLLHLTDRRRVINGLFFFMSLASLVLLMLYLGIAYDMRILSMLGAIITLLVIILIPIFLVVSIYILLSKGIELMKKEGITLAHGLSFLFGIGILGSVVFAPFILDKLESRVLKAIIGFFLSSFSYFTLGFIVYLTSSIIYGWHIDRRDKDYLIVLGSGLNQDKVTPLLASRIDKAIDFYQSQLKKGKQAKFIMSGGQGKDELLAEGEAMKNYALDQGVAEENILVENKSRTTEENLSYSMDIINKNSDKEKPKYIFFTNNYHVFRTTLIGKKIGININGRGSSVKLYFYISAIIREYIAVIVMYKNFNLVVLLAIFLLSIVKVF